MLRDFGYPVVVGASEPFKRTVRTVDQSIRFEDSVVGATGDILLFGGGGYFGPAKGIDPLGQFRPEHRRYREIFDAAEARGLETHIIGPEVGPGIWPLLSSVWRPIFEGAATVAVRNQPSADYVSQVFRRDALNVGDLVLGITPAWLAQVADGPLRRARANVGLHLTQKVVGESLLSRSFRAAFVEAVSGADTKEVVLFSDQLGLASAPAVKVLSDELSRRGKVVDIFEYDNVVQLCLLLSSTGNIITTKLHVGVVSLAFGNSPVAVSLHPKIARFYRDVGLTDRTFSFFTPKRQMEERIRSLINRPVDSTSVAKQGREIFGTYERLYCAISDGSATLSKLSPNLIRR